jgi:hypothetical protein
MEKSRDSSVWRNLAVAFGDGLAFGVGIKLTQNAPAKTGPAGKPEVDSRLVRLEQKIDRIERAPAAAASAANLDPQVLDALTRALEARLQETTALVDRRLSELDVKLAVELKTLRQQDHAIASNTEARLEEVQKHFDGQILSLLQKVNEDRNALQNQVIALHREFAAAVADIVEEQVATQVEERVSALAEQRLADLVRAQLAPVEQQFGELREQLAAKDRELAEIRRHALESDRNVLDVMLSTGELFRQAASRLGGANPPVAAPEPPAEPEATQAQTLEPEAADAPPRKPPESAGATTLYRDSDLPGFAQPRKASVAAAWSIPLVTSFLLTAGCVALLQYL